MTSRTRRGSPILGPMPQETEHPGRKPAHTHHRRGLVRLAALRVGLSLAERRSCLAGGCGLRGVLLRLAQLGMADRSLAALLMGADTIASAPPGGRQRTRQDRLCRWTSHTGIYRSACGGVGGVMVNYPCGTAIAARHFTREGEDRVRGSSVITPLGVPTLESDTGPVAERG
jgi:hypothetical protein